MKKLLFPFISTLLLTSLLIPGCTTKAPTPSPELEPAPPPASEPTPSPTPEPTPSEPIKWELVNPQGAAVEVEKVDITPHPDTLEGKTIALRWNGKAGGDMFLDRVAELLVEQVKDVDVIKLYEELPKTVFCCQAAPADMFDKIAAFQPDLVIGAQAD
ncbi:MAG: hypothetical protein R6T78_05185 [Dehalococcoidales bacterium]